MDKRVPQNNPIVQLTTDQRKDAVNRAIQPYTLLYYNWAIKQGGIAVLRITNQGIPYHHYTKQMFLECPKRSYFNSSFEQAVVELAERFPDLKILGRVPNTNYLICEYYDFTKSKD